MGCLRTCLLGLGVAGKTKEEVRDLIREAVEFHLEGMRQNGETIPEPNATTKFITV